MEANMTELWQIVESLQLELSLVRANLTASLTAASVVADDLATFGTDMDMLWLMLGSILVIFMQAGFGMLEVGSVGVKHTKNLLIKNLIDLIVAALVWWVCGHGIAFDTQSAGAKLNKFVGRSGFFLKGEEWEDESGYYSTTQGYNYALWLFEWSFCSTAVTITSGAVGERITMAAYFIFALFMVGLVFPMVARWGWNSQGWASAWSSDRDDLLFGCGVIDFAGSGIVHASGGMAALIFTTLMGPRQNRFTASWNSNMLERQSAVTKTLGTFILWVGWYGFNGCSTLYISGRAHVAAKAMVCTSLSAAGGGLGAASASMILFHYVGPEHVANGILSGLVASTGGCAIVEPEASFIIGIVAAINYLVSSRILQIVHVDDMVDASPIHLANGVWGLIAAGLFATQEGYSASYYEERAHRCCGWLYGCGPSQLLANMTFGVVVLCWAGAWAFIIASSLKFVGILRISKEVERRGTDSVAHGEDLPESVMKLLTKIEVLTAKMGYIDADRSFSSRDGTARQRTPSIRPASASSATGRQAALTPR